MTTKKTEYQIVCDVKGCENLASISIEENGETQANLCEDCAKKLFGSLAEIYGKADKKYEKR